MCISRPTTALGIFDVVQAAVQKLGFLEISREQCTKLVGIGTDGAAANIASAGLKELLGKELLWIFWMWCMAHRLELAVKDAFRKTSFDLVDEMLLRSLFSDFLFFIPTRMCFCSCTYFAIIEDLAIIS